MKKIGIDFLSIENSPAGIGQYTLSLFSKLFEIDKQDHFVVYTTKKPSIKFPKNVENSVIPWPEKMPLKGIRWMKKVTADIQKRHLDLFFSPSNQLFSILFPKTVQFIDDLSPIKFPKFFNIRARITYPIMTKLSISRAYKIITITEQIKNELLEFSSVDPEKITVIYPSINQNILNEPQKLVTYDLNCDYILSISTLEPRKNHRDALKLFADLIKNPAYSHYKYYIVGKEGWYFDNIFNTVKELELSQKVVFLGYVADQYIADLLMHAKCLFFLSHYEGFGMPPVEALYFNTPVIVNDIPVFHEIYGDLATYIDCRSINENINAYTTQIIGAINKTMNSKDIIAEKFNNERSAYNLLNLIDHL